MWQSLLRDSSRLAVGLRTLLLLRFFPRVLSRFMMSNDAAGAGTKHTVMSGIVTSNGADRSALEATCRLDGGRGPTPGD